MAATNGTSGTIPTHAAGDLIVIFAFARNSTTVPPAPAAGGTVPTWSFVNQGNAGAACVGVVATAVATANNHTTGTWSGADSVTAVVIRGQAASPIGGQAGGGASTLDATAPAVTLSKTDGSSILLHFMGARTGGATVTWGAAPAGYTKRTEITSGGPICVLTKDATTTDGAVTVTRTGGTTGYSGHTIEIIRG
ncbi:hypothetical protein BTO20_11540 [Mycobacterium dioxanotrophicus]|uniref:Uncharacterized protein n=1 Tax=Mycobacterium dioxanotrophicus TaxID=482462 RepID=A0A1Y0CE65_9MYCO|nr:hypothetical protein BTO20_11540 [Mycobacterium dioxanotrophicus]